MSLPPLRHLVQTLVAAAVLSVTALPPAQADTVTYTYDAAGRLTGADYSGGQRITYTYDTAGNLVRRDVVARGGSGVHDLAVVKITVSKSVTASGPVTRSVDVQIQNRSAHDETVEAGHLGDGVSTGLVRLRVSLVDDDGEGCLPAQVVLDAAKNALLFKKSPKVIRPKVVKPKQKLTIQYLVTYHCPSVRKKDKTDATAGDYAHAATVHHEALGGILDTHPADDGCPRSVTPPFERDPHPDATIKDRGCGNTKDDKTLGDPVLTNIVAKP